MLVVNETKQNPKARSCRRHFRRAQVSHAGSSSKPTIVELDAVLDRVRKAIDRELSVEGGPEHADAVKDAEAAGQELDRVANRILKTPAATYGELVLRARLAEYWADGSSADSLTNEAFYAIDLVKSVLAFGRRMECEDRQLSRAIDTYKATDLLVRVTTENPEADDKAVSRALDMRANAAVMLILTPARGPQSAKQLLRIALQRMVEGETIDDAETEPEWLARFSGTSGIDDRIDVALLKRAMRALDSEIGAFS